MSRRELLQKIMSGEVGPQNRAERRAWEQHEKREARRGRRAQARVQAALASYPEAVAA